MKRRDLLKKAPLAAIGLATFQTAFAQAQTSDGWINKGPGFDLKVVFKQGEAMGILYRFAQGLTSPRHYHNEGEYNLVLSGTFQFQNSLDVYRAGDYFYAPKGSFHAAAKAGPEGVTLFVFTSRPARPV